jgi:N-acetylglucosaminyl-diphospho-decaprenol L-rhamnosyltransferase
VSDAASSLAIVIVTYNSRHEIEGCLRSLQEHAMPVPTEVVVVDNGSTDGTAQLVAAQWPDVLVIEPGANLGFARANNLGIRKTTADYVLLLNPDTVVRPGALRRLLDALLANPDAAAAGPRLADVEGAPELSFGWAISPLGELRQRVLLALHDRGVGPVRRMIDRWTRTPGAREWLSGACLLVRRTDLEAVGLLDERFFMYTEDVDLCVSLRARGRRVLFVPEAEVLHLRGRSAARNPHTERLRRASQIAYYEKHHPQWVPWLRRYLRLTGKLPE